MQDWVVVLIFCIAVVAYVALQQLIFKFQFRECAFTLIFLNAVTMILMLSTRFQPLFVWLEIASIVLIILYGIYMGIMLRFMRDKVQKRVMNSVNIDDIFKNIMSGMGLQNPSELFPQNPDAQKKPDRTVREDDIKVSEDPSEESSDQATDNTQFDLGDIIIDESPQKDDQSGPSEDASHSPDDKKPDRGKKNNG